MKLMPGERSPVFRTGQTISVFLSSDRGEIEVPMTVKEIYNNGDFDGEVFWGNA